MNFGEFRKYREEILSQRPGVIDCAETNLYAALAALIPVQSPLPAETIHRCHLAEEWTTYFGLPSGASRRALVSAGVRDSLSRLFRHYANLEAKLWLPTDNYPVYGQLALACGFRPRKFATIPQLELPSEAPHVTQEVMVVTNPLKPMGRWLSQGEVEELEVWLRGSSLRRLIVDAVFNLDAEFHSTSLRLLGTGQAILLHSLTKGWLHPRLFGIALVPDADASALKKSFQVTPLPQSSLARARMLMAQHSDMPAKVSAHIMAAGHRLQSKLPELVATPSGLCHFSYFYPVPYRWSDLLDSKGVLGLPVTVFGSPHTDFTILTSLNFV